LNFKEILELIDKVAECGIAGVELEQGGTRLRIEGKVSHPKVFTYAGEVKSSEQHASIPMAALSSAPPESPHLDAKAAAEASEAGQHIITAPIVGTFYRSPNPEAGTFVNVGDRVSKGQVLCIIEAMKLMNEIESDVDGIIGAIYPQNGQPVEYGEKLFAVK
jgi:acetyl-CoA carboxylase biotin carboxyl carrier protein